VTGSRLLSPLGLRLAVAFVAVAVAAVAVLAGLTLVSASGEVSALVTETHRQDAHAAAAARRSSPSSTSEGRSSPPLPPRRPR
jgi:hypothetical protein